MYLLQTVLLHTARARNIISYYELGYVLRKYESSIMRENLLHKLAAAHYDTVRVRNMCRGGGGAELAGAPVAPGGALGARDARAAAGRSLGRRSRRARGRPAAHAQPAPPARHCRQRRVHAHRLQVLHLHQMIRT